MPKHAALKHVALTRTVTDHEVTLYAEDICELLARREGCPPTAVVQVELEDGERRNLNANECRVVVTWQSVQTE